MSTAAVAFAGVLLGSLAAAATIHAIGKRRR